MLIPYKSQAISNTFVPLHVQGFQGRGGEGQVQTIMKNELAVFEREGIPSGCVTTTLNITS